MSVLSFQHGRGTTDKLDVYVGAPGEILFDTVTKQLCVQDGSTRGGIRVAKDLSMRGATVFTAGAQGLVPAPAAGDQLKFLRADGSWQVPVDTTYTFTNNNATLAWDSTVTLAVVGGVSITAKLPASPVVEFTPATAAPLAAGTATVGTSDKYAREDHVHPAQTSVSGNAGTATKLATARSLKVDLGSTTAVTFDGSAAQDAIPVTGTLAVANGGTGQTSVANIKAGKDAAGNTITETYATKTELANLSKGLVQVVSAAPTTGVEGVIYLVGTTSGSDTYNKYVWENDRYVYLGSTTLDLSNYVVKSDAIKALEVSGRVITYTRADGTNGTITTQDSNTTYSAGTGLTLSGTTFSVTDGTYAAASHTHSYLPLSGGTLTGDITIKKSGPKCLFQDTRATKGTAPAANIWNQFFFVRDTAGVAYGGVEHGFKSSLENRMNLIVYPGTTNDTSTNAQIAVGFDSNGDWFTYAPTPGASDNTTKMATTAWVRSATGNTSLNAATATKATQDSAGQQINTTYIKALSVNGKVITYTKGDNTTGTITTQDTNTTYTFTAGTSALSWNTEVTLATVGGLAIKAKLPTNPNTDTHWTSHLYAGTSTGVANAATTNGNTYLICADNETARNRVHLVGAGATTVVSDNAGKVTITSTNTTYSAGYGLTLNGTQFSIASAINFDFLSLTYPSLTRGTAPSSWINRDIRFVDSVTTNAIERRTLGWVRSWVSADNIAGLQLACFKPSSSEDTAVTINLNYAASGTASVLLQGMSIAATDNSAQIATTAWVRSATGGTALTAANATKFNNYTFSNAENTSDTWVLVLKSRDIQHRTIDSILSTLTKTQVTTALGYTPPTANNAVTNTLDTTAKAYVTATTSASTNTGTQVFDTGVYLDDTAGRLVAGSFDCRTGNGGYSYISNISLNDAVNYTGSTNYYAGLMFRDQSDHNLAFCYNFYSKTTNQLFIGCYKYGNLTSTGAMIILRSTASSDDCGITAHLSSWTLLPAATNTYTVGSSNYKWKEIWCSQTSINSTSDERMKSEILDISDEVLDAWESVRWKQFHFKDAVKEKGVDKARFHTGVVAQQVAKIFTDAGIDPGKYGWYLYDSWEKVDGITDDSGNVVKHGVAAGDSYGVRYIEALCIEAAYQRRRADRLEARLARIEQKLNI